MNNHINTNQICDICGSRNSEILFTKGRNNEAVLNVICQNCGLVYVANRADDESITKLYVDGTFSIHARGDRLPSKEKIAKSEAQAIDRFKILLGIVKLDDFEGFSALDVGCGLGSFLRILKIAGFQTKGIEPDIDYASYGSKLYSIDIEAASRYEDITFSPESFSLIASFHVLEHVLSPRGFLEKMRMELKAGGFLFLETPCIEKPYGGDLARFFWSAHLYTFSSNTLTKFLENLGFNLIYSGYSGNFLQIIAQKSTLQNSIQKHDYPFDNPQDVRIRTLLLQKEFLDETKKKRAYQSGYAVLDFPIRVYHKLQNDPKGIPTALRTRFHDFTKSWTKQISAVHIGVHQAKNAGDIVLLPAVRRAIDLVVSPNEWILQPASTDVSPRQAMNFHKSVNFIVIGGGGLFLPTNTQSGWVWSCPIDSLRNIRVPIIGFAIGYNLFRNQENFNSSFDDNLREFVMRSAFIGLRNTGSIHEVAKKLQDETLSSKLSFQPCPTTVIRYLYPNYANLTMPDNQRKLVFNPAFDRYNFRYGQSEDYIMTEIVKALKWAEQSGWEIIVTFHIKSDANILPWLIREKLKFKVVELFNKTEDEILHFYENIPLTIGMRSHSQMIPFGLGNAIISIVSHNKIAYFLDDIGHPEWGLDVNDLELKDSLIDKIKTFDENRGNFINQISDAQEKLWNITQHNLQIISRVLTGLS